MNRKKIIILLLVLIFSSLIFVITKKEKLNIYSLNIQTEEIGLKSQIDISKNISLEEKIKKLMEILSEENFDGKKIELLEIKTENGSKIAYINLIDKSEKDSWYPYFQGSLGAFSTKLSIIETILQRSYKGKWIDGVKLSYNGKYEELDHINFEDAIYWRNINIKK